jgi:hypothetical protein
MQYNEKRLAEIRSKADDIFRVVAVDDKRLSEYQLRTAVDYMARTIGMFADMCMDQKNEIVDPLGYIEGKLGVAHQSVAVVHKHPWDDPEE